MTIIEAARAAETAEWSAIVREHPDKLGPNMDIETARLFQHRALAAALAVQREADANAAEEADGPDGSEYADDEWHRGFAAGVKAAAGAIREKKG